MPRNYRYIKEYENEILELRKRGFTQREIRYLVKFSKSNSFELYFEEQDIESFARKLERLYPSIEYINRLMTHSWWQRVIRFYDLDGNLIEVGKPV